MITNLQAVEFAKKAIGREYWYACYGNKATKELLAYKQKQYPKYYNRAAYNKGWTCDGQPVFDCIGLAVKGPIWCNGVYGAVPKYNSSQDVSANGMRSLCKKTGKMSTLPEVPGVLVFRDGHVGIYEGNGNVIEAKGHNYGVCRTKVSAGGWTSWGYCPWFEYTPKQVEPTLTEEQAKEIVKKAFDTINNSATQSTSATVSYTHKVKVDLNVRKGPGVTYKKLTYADLPEYIKKQMKNKTAYIPAGVKIHCYKINNGWYKIDEKNEIWIAGNYVTKL